MSDLVTVSGSGTKAPDLSIFTPLHLDELSWTDLSEGEGTQLTDPGQLMVIDFVLASGDTGKPLVGTAYDGSMTSVGSVANLAASIPGLEPALACAQAGTRVVVGLPASQINPDAASTLGLSAEESAVMLVDVRKVYLAKADGADQFTDSNGLPQVVRAPNGRPGVLIPDVAPPQELVVQTLKKGDGPAVTGEVPVRVNYTGLLWDTHTVFDSSWDREPASFDLNAVIPGFAEGLRGQTVGSQVLIVVPPADGYGDKAQGSIPAGSTLVFVVDILGLDAPPAS